MRRIVAVLPAGNVDAERPDHIDRSLVQTGIVPFEKIGVAQFSSVFRHPFKKDLYVALGDRWLTDLPEDMPDIGRAFYGFFSPTAEKTIDESELPSLTDENTSEADYVWLPLSFDEKGTPFLSWKRLWSTDEYEDL